MRDRHTGEEDRKARDVRPPSLMAQVERFCARCNDGLALVAAVLAILVLMTAAVRVPELAAQGLAIESDPGAYQAADPAF